MDQEENATEHVHKIRKILLITLEIKFAQPIEKKKVQFFGRKMIVVL